MALAVALGRQCCGPGSAYIGASVATRKKLRYITKAIEDIRVGDMVLARDEHGQDIGYRPVVDLLRNVSRAMATLTFADGLGRTATIDTTPAHPFWNETRQEFESASELEIGDTVVGPNGERLQLVDGLLRHEPNGIPVYNFTVNGYHTYYVVPHRTTDGEDGCDANGEFPAILVHNSGCKKKGGSSGGDSDADVDYQRNPNSPNDPQLDGLADALRDGQIEVKDLRKSGLSPGDIDEVQKRSRSRRALDHDPNKM